MATATANQPIKTHPAGAPWSFVDAAEFLGVSEGHVTNLANRGDIKSFRLGKRRLIADAEVRRIAAGEERY